MSTEKIDFAQERERRVQALIRDGILQTQSVIESLRKVPRENFVPPDLRSYAYVDSPLPIGYGQTISAPHG
jgi:protein-L-isoaspartate(D-aspartate) O-methyltransferase